MTITTPTDTSIRINREFAASPREVFDAHTIPGLVQRWLLGPDGWTLPVCETDLRKGGKYRYVWRHPDKGDMGMSGVYLEVDPPGLLVATERFDDEWYPRECVNTLIFTARGDATLMVLTLNYESQSARDIAFGSPMDQGMEASYRRLDDFFSQSDAA